MPATSQAEIFKDLKLLPGIIIGFVLDLEEIF
jgi:hypothetical protein